MFGAYVAGTGVNAVIPARGGDVVRLYLAKHRIEGSTYTTLVSTSLLQTLFDIAVASCASSSGRSPSTCCRARTFCRARAFRHSTTAGRFAIRSQAWSSSGSSCSSARHSSRGSPERVEEFKAKVAQGFAAFSDRSYYVRHVVSWQLLDWSLRLATVFFFLKAFGLPATLHNAAVVQVSQSLATVFPVSPGGIGTEQALLVYIFRNVTSKSLALSFSVRHARDVDRRERHRRVHRDPAHDRHAPCSARGRGRSHRHEAGDEACSRTAASRDRPRNRQSIARGCVSQPASSGSWALQQRCRRRRSRRPRRELQ